MPTKQPCAEQASALLNEEEWRKFKERQAFTEHELKKLEETWAFTKNEIQKLKERVKLDERGHTAIEDELQKFEDDLQKLKERVQKLQNDLQKHEETVQEIDNQRRVFLEAVRGTKDAQRKYFKDYIWKCGSKGPRTRCSILSSAGLSVAIGSLSLCISRRVVLSPTKFEVFLSRFFEVIGKSRTTALRLFLHL
jgi:uncharacterized protein (DUF3084 family)